MKKVIIIIILFISMLTGCTTNNNDGKIDISTAEYSKLLHNIFTEVTEDNEFWTYTGFTTHYPYIQVSIKPRKQMTKNEMEEQAKIIETNLLSELRKYEYKSGNIFKYNYEYINVYFYYTTESGQITRNGGPFLQIKILEIS